MRSRLSQKGMMALTVTIVVLIVVSIITIFVSRFVVTEGRVFKNDRDNAIASNAAQSGFDYALGYINSYPYVVLNALNYCSGGASSPTYSLPLPTSNPLPSDATYAMTFSCVTQPVVPAGYSPLLSNNYTFLQLTSTASVPGTFATRTITAQIKQFCGGISSPVTVRNNATLIQSSITNSASAAPLSIVAGGSVSFNNAASTSGFSANAAYTCSSATFGSASSCRDVLQNTNLLNAMNDGNFQRLYMGGLLSNFVQFSGMVYSPVRAAYILDCRIGSTNKVFNENTTISSQGCTTIPGEIFGTNSNRFPGNNGAVIYIIIGYNNLTLTASAGGTFSMGTSTAPVMIVVNSTGGTLTISGGSGNMIINGNIYTNAPVFNVTGSTTTITGMIFSLNQLNINSARLNGALVANTASLDGAIVDYTPAALDTIRSVKNGLCAGGYALVPGSWQDFQ